MARLRKQAEESLRAKQAEMQEAQRVAHVGSWRWDAATDVTTGSDELYRIYGLDRRTATFPDFKAQDETLYPHESWEQIDRAVKETLSTRVGYELDVQAFRNGEPIWITTRSEVVEGSDGAIIGLRGTVQDITARKHAEEALKQREQQLHFIADNAAVLIAQCDLDCRYKFVNRPYAVRFGLEPHQVIGKRIPEIVGEKAFEKFKDRIAEALSGKPVQFEVEIPYRTGVTHVMRCDYTPERDASRQIVGLVAAIIDITERKQAEERLRQSEE